MLGDEPYQVFNNIYDSQKRSSAISEILDQSRPINEGVLFDLPTETPADATTEGPYTNWEPEFETTNGNGLRVVANKKRIDRVLGTLMEQYNANRFPYNLDSTRLPHDPRHMPESLKYGSTDHAMFLWNICYYMRGGIKSVDAVKRMAMVYENRPELFNATVAAETSEDEIAGVLKEFGLGFQGTVSKHWVENSGRMVEKWNGDPRNIFAGVTDYETSLERIKNDKKGGGFLGFQEKMVSMAIYYLMDEGLIDKFIFPVPVDLHVLRVSIANKLIGFPGTPHKKDLYSDKTLAKLRKIYFDYANEHGVDPLRLCDAVWLLSQSTCVQHPGNITLEPKGRTKRNGRSTILIPSPVDVNDERQREAYAGSCAKCPLDSTCEFNIPGKPYYVSGVVYIRGKRVKFPAPSQSVAFINAD